MQNGRESYSETLAESGYTLGYVGKWHVSETESPEDFGFDDYVPNSEYAEWREKRGLPERPRTNGWFGEIDPAIDANESRLAWGVDRSIQLLERYATSDERFHLRFDPFEPPLPNVVPEPYASMYNPDDIDPWPSFADDLADKPYIQRQQRRTWQLEDWAPIVSRYLGEISLLDAQIGRLLDALDRLGLTDDTLVVCTADHGDLCGGYGMIDKHYIMYDDVIHVPLIAQWPGTIPEGESPDAFISQSIDLPATFCDVAGVCAPSSFEGRSLVPVLRDGPSEQTRRSDIYAMYHGNQFGLYTQRMARNDRWKYVWNATAKDELYDLATDPGEIDNFALDPTFIGKKRSYSVECSSGWIGSTTRF